MLKTLYIMRGLPGSGKSTRAHQLAGEDGVVISHDDVLSDDRHARDVMTASDWKEVYALTDSRVRTALAYGTPVVVVDNSHVTHRAYRPHVEAAQRFGYEVEVVTVHPDHPRDDDLVTWAERGDHGVSLDKLRRMRERWEP